VIDESNFTYRQASESNDLQFPLLQMQIMIRWKNIMPDKDLLVLHIPSGFTLENAKVSTTFQMIN